MTKRILSLLLVASMILSLILAGCSPAAPDEVPPETSEDTVTVNETEEIVTESTSTPTVPTAETEAPTEAVTEPPTKPATEAPTEPAFSAEQQNSINMMNYLAALVTEINASSGSRVYLENVYLELSENTDPSKVDSYTLQQYNHILDLLDEYRMIEEKRDRLNYLYNQNRAHKLRSAIPNPLSLLNVVESQNALKTVASMIFLAVDSINSYESSTLDIDTQYLQDNWNLNDQEAQILHNSRKEMFSYLVRITSNYYIPGTVTLNEEYVTEFVKQKKDSNVQSRIRFLERKVDTYRYFGEYWLLLAESYYQNNDPQKCLDAIAEYESLGISFYRIDHKYAAVLPYAIVSAKETMTTAEYVDFAEEYTELILDNSSWYDWATQYFVCQTYLDLYSVSGNADYLQYAYDLALDAVSYLAKEQDSLNKDYLKQLEKKKADKKASEKEKQEIDEYNEYVEYLLKVRETELAPIHEPLRLFCELLFGLAYKMSISVDAQKYAESIFREYDENGHYKRIFLDHSLDNLYRFNPEGYTFSTNDIPIEFTGKQIIIPAQYVSSVSEIILTSGGNIVDDWTVKKVDRNKSEKISDFVVTFISEDIHDFEFKDGASVIIEVYPYDGAAKPISFCFDVEKGFLNITTSFNRR